jgi:ABC-type phosphate/phosphonate transport system substrate-binding protein
LLWLVLAASYPSAAPQAATPARRTRLFALASRSVVGAINVADAQAAFSVWFQSIGRRRGFELTSRFEVVSGFEALRKQVEGFSADVVVVDSLEYLRLAPLKILAPVVGIARGKTGAFQSRCLVVGRESAYANIDDLRGKNILTWSRTETDFGLMWIETLLNERRLGRAERFFASISHAAKPTAACLPVFFAKADACVVDAAAWEAMTEMNPQLGSRLRVLATSPPYVDGLLCRHVRHTDAVDEFQQAVAELHRDPEGRQLLMVFRADRADPITDQDLASVRALWANYTSFAAPETAAAAQATGRP